MLRHVLILRNCVRVPFNYIDATSVDQENALPIMYTSLQNCEFRVQ